MYCLLHGGNPKTTQDSGLIVLASIKRRILSQRQGCVFCNQFSCIVWGLSFLGGYKTRKRNMKQFTTQQRDKELNLIPTINFPTYCFIHEKSVIDYIYTVITILVACVDQNKSELFRTKYINVTHFIQPRFLTWFKKRREWITMELRTISYNYDSYAW